MGRVAYLFPGQGSQEIGMGLPFAETSEAAADVFARANEALGFDLTGLIRSGPADALALTENTQPAVLVASIAAYVAGSQGGLPPADYVAGHSLGEYSALVAAGALDLDEAVRVVRARGRFMQEAVPLGQGAMSAVLSLAAEAVALACAEVEAELPGQCVVPANINGAEQVVIAGHTAAVKAAGQRCLARGARRVIELDVSAPFHSPLMKPVVARLAEVLDGVTVRDATLPLVTNVEASPETSGARLRQLLIEQVTAPVRWTDVIARLASEGCDTFIELGPGTVLSGLARRQVPGARVYSVSHPTRLTAVTASLAA
jgi:[acyl-carrier-protein] S-malonyltransferase